MSKMEASRKLMNIENRISKPVLSKRSSIGNQSKRTALSTSTNIISKHTADPSKCPKIKTRAASKLESVKENTTTTQHSKWGRPVQPKSNPESSEDSDEMATSKSSKIPKISSSAPSTSSTMSIAKIPPKPTVQPLFSFSSLMIPDDVENIDANDDNNVLLSPEYVNDIYSYLRHIETKQFVKPNFLSIQKEMTPKMRAILVDWLISVHYQFRLLPETLYLGISIMDRFFQREIISKQKIQLVGVTAFFIASKFEEIYPPEIKDFIVICDQLYHKRDIIKMEIAILKSLKFELGRPLPLHFLRRNSKAAHADTKIHTMAKYMMELALTEYECAHWYPSLLAATALYVTIKILPEKLDWSSTLAFYSNYPEDKLQPYAVQLCKVIRNADKSKYQNCKKKYSSAKFYEISKSPELSCKFIDEMAGIKL